MLGVEESLDLIGAMLPIGVALDDDVVPVLHGPLEAAPQGATDAKVDRQYRRPSRGLGGPRSRCRLSSRR